MDQRHSNADTQPAAVNDTTPNGETTPEVTDHEAAVVQAYFTGWEIRQRLGIVSEIPDQPAAVILARYLGEGLGEGAQDELERASTQAFANAAEVDPERLQREVLAWLHLATRQIVRAEIGWPDDEDQRQRLVSAVWAALFRKSYKSELYQLWPPSPHAEPHGPMLLFPASSAPGRRILHATFGFDRLPTIAEARARLEGGGVPVMIHTMPVVKDLLLSRWGGWLWLFFPESTQAEAPEGEGA